MTKMEWYVTNGSKGVTNIGSVRRHICTASVLCVPFFFRKTAWQKYFFQILFQKNAQIVNLKNPDLDLIRRVWILWIHDPFLDLPKKTQNSFLDSEIRIWIFPKKRTLKREASLNFLFTLFMEEMFVFLFTPFFHCRSFSHWYSR